MIVLRVIFFVSYSVAMLWVMVGGAERYSSLLNFHSFLICLMGGFFYFVFQINQSCKLKRFYNGTYCAALLSFLIGIILILMNGIDDTNLLMLNIGNNLIVLFYAGFINEFLIKGLLYYKFIQK